MELSENYQIIYLYTKCKPFLVHCRAKAFPTPFEFGLSPLRVSIYYSYLSENNYYQQIAYKGQCSPCFDDPDGIGHDEGEDASLSCRHHVQRWSNVNFAVATLEP